MVRNAGGLPPTVSIQTLKKKHPSVPRNKQIAEIFYYAGMIEVWGGGTTMILDESVTAGLPQPAFGVTWKIPYKADEDTFAGKYRIAGHTRIRKYYG